MSTTFFPYVGAFVWISLLLVIGVFLRAKISFLQKGLIPSALIGGIIGFCLMNFGLIGMPTANGWEVIPPKAFGVLVAHLFSFGFVGIGLMQQNNAGASEQRKTNWIRSGALWMALIYCLIYAMQGITGKTIFELYALISSQDIFTGSGYLVSIGFSQNPGAAQAIAGIWEREYGVQGVSSIALAFGATGFLCAIAFGLPLANRGIKKGWSAEKNLGDLPKSLVKGLMGKNEASSCANATTHSANIDNFAFHFAIMFALYAVGYLFALGWSLFAWPEEIAKIRGLGFGLLYVWSMLAGMLFRKILAGFKTIHILDASTTRRITGTTVDFMICAVFMGIAISDIQAIIIPFLFTVVCAGMVSYIMITWFARRMPEYGFERGLATLGCYTGTVASGLLLLRVVDPEFKSPAAVELAIMNVFILPIVQIIYINLPFVPAEGSIMLPVLIGYVIAMPIALYALGFVKKRLW